MMEVWDLTKNNCTLSNGIPIIILEKKQEHNEKACDWFGGLNWDNHTDIFLKGDKEL